MTRGRSTGRAGSVEPSGQGCRPCLTYRWVDRPPWPRGDIWKAGAIDLWLLAGPGGLEAHGMQGSLGAQLVSDLRAVCSAGPAFPRGAGWETGPWGAHTSSLSTAVLTRGLLGTLALSDHEPSLSLEAETERWPGLTPHSSHFLGAWEGALALTDSDPLPWNPMCTHSTAHHHQHLLQPKNK